MFTKGQRLWWWYDSEHGVRKLKCGSVHEPGAVITIMKYYPTPCEEARLEYVATSKLLTEKPI